MALSTRLLTLRRSPVLLKLPPYLSALCILIGIAWLLILPLDEYSRETYVSENAFLPGQVHTYFTGSEHNVFRAYRQEVYALSQQSDAERVSALEEILRMNGLKAATQPYAWNVAGEQISGTNVYALLQGPRADATEAMVLVAAWRNFESQINYSGVALALTLARYFKRWSVWSKDIIVLIPDDSVYGPEAWVAAYHSVATTATTSRNVSALPIKGGALQAAVALDYPVGPWGHRFDKLDIVYDGINGALPNLDLLNTAINIATSQTRVTCTLHDMKDHDDGYKDRLLTLAKGVMTQSVGHATGPHSAFVPYHVDAITLRTVGDGWHDEMTLGRTAESLFRSINNLLEHIHQSFFFYILLNAERFVSIGNYLPAAMIIASSFTISALAMWVRSAQLSDEEAAKETRSSSGKAKKPEMEAVKSGEDVALVPKTDLKRVERKMFLPAVTAMGVHVLALLPIYLLNTASQTYLSTAFHTILLLSILLPVQLGTFLSKATPQQVQMLQTLSLLFLGATLSTLATLNFSLAFVVGILCSPLNFVRPLPYLPARSSLVSMADGQQYFRDLALYPPVSGLYLLVSPPAVLYGLHFYLRGFQVSVGVTLLEVAKGVAQGVWTSFVVWGVWWPAWVIGGAVLFSGTFRARRSEVR